MQIPGKEIAIAEIKKVLAGFPEVTLAAKQLPKQYIGKRGLMVVDVVASRQRKYDEYVKPKLLPTYVAKATDLSLFTLSNNAPTWMKLREGEALVMKKVAQEILKYSKLSKDEFHTVRWIDFDVEIGKSYDIYLVADNMFHTHYGKGKMRVISLEIKKIKELSEDFVKADADCDYLTFLKMMENWYGNKKKW